MSSIFISSWIFTKYRNSFRKFWAVKFPSRLLSSCPKNIAKYYFTMSLVNSSSHERLQFTQHCYFNVFVRKHYKTNFKHSEK